MDIGCGYSPRGDVNVDLFRATTVHQFHKEPLDTKLIKNYVRASTLHLPFRDNIFDVVYASDVIEHISEPFLMLKEMVRVSKHKIIVRCPHSLGERRNSRRDTGHVNHFRPKWFWKAFELLPVHKPKIWASKWRAFPHDAFPIFQLPSQITCVAFKKQLRG